MPLAKVYNIVLKCVAGLPDIFACVFQRFIIPHGGQLMLCMSLAGLSPFEVISVADYPMLLAAATIIATSLVC